MWADYWQLQMQGVDEAEDIVDESWDKSWLLLLLLMGRLRRRLVGAALRLDTQNRAQVMRFRALARREVDLFNREALVGIVGRRTAYTGTMRQTGALDPLSPRSASRGIQGKAIRGSAEAFGRAWERAQARLETDVERALESPRPQPVARTVLEMAQERLRDAGVELSEQEAEDLEDVLAEADDNPVRNILRATSRLVEDMIGLSSRFTRRGSARDAVAYIVGKEEDGRRVRPDDDPGSGWSLNRNTMRLSITAYVRAIYRRRLLAGGQAMGIERFRLELPQRWLGEISPFGRVGRNLWKIRTLDEWLEVAARENKDKRGGAAWDLLGFHHNDRSYPVPVPDLYIEQAERHAEKLRARWLSHPPGGVRSARRGIQIRSAA